MWLAVMAEFWSSWNWNPLIGGLLAFTGWRYMDGVWGYWQRAGAGRGVQRWQVAAFWGGMAVLFIALISPIDTLSTTSLTMHMIQHMLLMLIAPPLLVLGLPSIACVGMIPMRWRQGVVRWWNSRQFLRRFWHLLSSPLAAWGLLAVVLWGWHIPVLYEAAVNDPLVHLLEHASFFGAALLFWWSLRERYAVGVLLVFTTAVHSSLLGALMTLSSQVWYPIYDSLEDQQLAGLIMWVPGGVIFLLAGLILLWRWLYVMEVMDAKSMV